MITIVDYGMGNLRSVQKAFAHLGFEAQISDRPEAIERATKLVLPGVGAFGDAMAELRRQEMISPLRSYLAAGRTFLGICLGLQLLFETSEEDGPHDGLGVWPGRVVKFRVPPEFKVPHMGWNQLQRRRDSPLLAGMVEEAHVYFVHSYYALPDDEGLISAVSHYPEPFAAVVERGRVFATQFHPEKSQAVGLAMLRRFAELPDSPRAC